MLENLHQKLMQKSASYEIWHDTSWSSAKNASFLLLFMMMSAGIVWVASLPPALRINGKNVLGVATGPAEVDETAPNIVIASIDNSISKEFTLRIKTDEDAFIWVEYESTDESVFGKSTVTPFSMIHDITLKNLKPNMDYRYRVASEDAHGNKSYSSVYTFTK